MAPTLRYISATIAILASISVSAAPTNIQTRQLAGEGNLFDSMFTGTDNGVGYGVENAEENTANLISSLRLGSAPAASRPASGPSLLRRQGDKIANGAAQMLAAAGQNGLADVTKTNGDNIDGQLTDDAATAGSQIETDEENFLPQVGSLIP